MIYEYKGDIYPDYLKQGNAIKYILPYAEYFLSGSIIDIGGTSKWHFPNAEYVNVIDKDNDYHAMFLPDKKYDSVFSSHTLEHLKDPYYAIQYWGGHLKKNGVMFLYLPSEKMKYWAHYNPLHLHIFTPSIIKGWMEKIGFKDIITSEQDLYFSFSVPPLDHSNHISSYLNFFINSNWC